MEVFSNINKINPIVKKKNGIDIYLITYTVPTAIENILWILDWIYKKTRQEHRSYNKSSLQKSKNYSLKSKAWSCLYVMLVCELEKMIEKELEIIKNRVDKLRLPITIIKGKRFLKSNKILEEYRFYRNKFFAHTAWSDPKKRGPGKDTPSTRLSSLMLWSCGNISFDNKSITVGGNNYTGNLVDLDGTLKFSYNLKSDKRLTKKKGIDIIRDHGSIKKSFYEAIPVFRSIIEKYNQNLVQS